MKILHLNLKREWFDLILSGEKKEEYREIKSFWIKRLKFDIWNTKPFDVIYFKNGYQKDAPEMHVELMNIRIGKPKYEWSKSSINQDVYILELGKIIQTKNC